MKNASLLFKKLVLRAFLVTCFPVVALHFAGCTEIEIIPDFDGFLSSGYSGGYGGGGSSNYADARPGIGLTIDSAIYIEKNSAVLTLSLAQLYGDSIAVLKGTRVTIIRTLVTSQVRSIRIFTTGPDTVDFRKKSPYQFQLKIDNLLPGSRYEFFVSRGFSTTGFSNTTQLDSTSYAPNKFGLTSYTIRTKD